MYQIIFLIVLTLIGFYFLCIQNSKKEEGYCSSCMANVFGPVHYTYRYGDPFHAYVHQQRQRFSRLSPPQGARGSWMNPSKQEKTADKKELEDKMNKWMHEFGQPKPLFAHSMAEAACRNRGDCGKVKQMSSATGESAKALLPNQGCIKQTLINDVDRYRYWEPAYSN